VKVEPVQKKLPKNTKLGVLGVRGRRRIPWLYLNIPGRRDIEDETKGCTLRHAKHCYRRSSQVQISLPREEGTPVWTHMRLCWRWT
jgi:hypothetical protein